jgi:hypothetical protein
LRSAGSNYRQRVVDKSLATEIAGGRSRFSVAAPIQRQAAPVLGSEIGDLAESFPRGAPARKKKQGRLASATIGIVNGHTTATRFRHNFA